VRVLFDTNVVLDVLLEREPHVRNATALFAAIDRGWLTGLLCATTITTVYYIGSQGQGRAYTHKKLEELLAMFTIAPVTHPSLVTALRLKFPDFEDAVLHEAAVAADAQGIVTRNEKDFRPSPLRIYSPAALIATLRTLHGTA
jgi:predicted nucleic acid-binding protein